MAVVGDVVVVVVVGDACVFGFCLLACIFVGSAVRLCVSLFFCFALSCCLALF